MSSCSGPVQIDTAERRPASDLIASNAEHEGTNLRYVLEDIELTKPEAWIVLLAFTWPPMALGVSLYRTQGKSAVTMRVLEPFLIVGSLVCIEILASAFAQRREIGAHVAFGGVATYAFGAFWSDVAFLRDKRHAKNT